jgi:uncharacterized OB-fold protein
METGDVVAVRPFPSSTPDELDEPFWQACARREFLLHRCSECGRHYWPASCCLEHGWDPMEWTSASGRGKIHTFTVFRRQYHPAFEPPYAVVVVQLAEGPFFHTSLVDCAIENIEVGMPVEITFESDGRPMPAFRPSEPERQLQREEHRE